jgi:Flp pilus assembly protein TadG
MSRYKPAAAQACHHRLRLPGRWFKRAREDSGSQTVEFALVLIPLIGIVFLILDIAWVCFAQETLQHAVQMGVRAAITGSQQEAGIKSVVQENALGFLAGSGGLNQITVQCYQPTNLSFAVACSGGYVVEVAANNVQVSLLGPIIGANWTNVTLSANSSDIMESNPAGP